eukprot:553215_1
MSDDNDGKDDNKDDSNVLDLNNDTQSRIIQSIQYLLGFNLAQNFELPQITTTVDRNIEDISVICLDGAVLRIMEMYSKTNIQQEAIEACFEEIKIDLHKTILQILVTFTHITLLLNDDDIENEMQPEKNDNKNNNNSNNNNSNHNISNNNNSNTNNSNTNNSNTNN